MLISPWLVPVWRVRFGSRRGEKRARQQQHHLIYEISLFEILGRIIGTCFYIFCENHLFFFTGIVDRIRGAVLRCTGCRFRSFGLLSLAGRFCGARAVVSGRLGCCRLLGASAVHGLSFPVVWAAVACRVLMRSTGCSFRSFGLLSLAGCFCGARVVVSGRLDC